MLTRHLSPFVCVLSICLRALERAYSDLFGEVGQGIPAAVSPESSAADSAMLAHQHATAQVRLNEYLSKIAWSREALVRHNGSNRARIARCKPSCNSRDPASSVCQHQTAPELGSLLKFATG